MLKYIVESGLKEVYYPNMNYVAVGNFVNMESAFPIFDIDEKMIKEAENSAIPKLESFGDLDYIYLYDIDNNMNKGKEYWCFLKKEGIFIVCKEERDFERNYVLGKEERYKGINSHTRFFANFLNQLLIDDARLIQSLENRIEDLEEKILVSKPKDVNSEIIVLKKKLLFLRHYYEQLLEVALDIEENENNIIPLEDMRSFEMFRGRLERITKTIVMLRDYLTQVREAYQAQEDLRLNETMEIFTVITAIFLPLTLLTSWYGMNFKHMPELSFKYGYLGVFVIAIGIVAAMLYYFKKRNMFK